MQIKVKTLEEHGEVRPAGKSFEEKVDNTTSRKNLHGLCESSDLLFVPAHINLKKQCRKFSGTLQQLVQMDDLRLRQVRTHRIQLSYYFGK